MARTDKVFAVGGLLAVFFLIMMVNFTTPSDIGPLGVLVFFTLAYMACLSVMALACRAFFVVRGKLRNGLGVERRKSYYYGSVLAFVPIVLIFMRSFGGLNILEIALVVGFAAVGCFYISKRA